VQSGELTLGAVVVDEDDGLGALAARWKCMEEPILMSLASRSSAAASAAAAAAAAAAIDLFHLFCKMRSRCCLERRALNTQSKSSSLVYRFVQVRNSV
jgi:hypothetical protein